MKVNEYLRSMSFGLRPFTFIWKLKLVFLINHWVIFNKISYVGFYTLVNVYVALPVFTPVAGRSYAHFMEQNGGAQYVNSEFGRYFHFCWC